MFDDFLNDMPVKYPCLTKVNIWDYVTESVVKQKWSFKWYYYDDIILWEQKMIEYKNTMKNKIKVSENENFIL